MILRVDSYQQDGGDSTYRATAEGSDTQPYSRQQPLDGDSDGNLPRRLVTLSRSWKTTARMTVE